MINGKKVIGIICECNPFHKGHIRLINEAKKNGDILIAVMSGNYVQRGEVSVYNKYQRTNELLKNGIDIVIELPVEYVMSSAKYFAKAGVTILNKLKFVDYLIFGSKINNISKLTNISKIKLENNKNLDYNPYTMNYPQALGKQYGIKLSSNDILAVEYIRAIDETKSKIKPICIKRKNDLPTATALREKIKSKINNDNFSDVLNYKIFDAKENNKSFNDISCMTNDLNNAIINTANINLSFSDKAKLLKTKNRTLANIKRIFFNIIFDIKKQDIHKKNKDIIIKYIRILGIKKEALPLLKNIKIPYYLSYSPNNFKAIKKLFPKSNPKDPSILINTYASNLYNFYAENNKVEANTPPIISK